MKTAIKLFASTDIRDINGEMISVQDRIVYAVRSGNTGSLEKGTVISLDSSDDPFVEVVKENGRKVRLRHFDRICVYNICNEV